MFDLISIGSITVDLYFQGKSLTFKDERFQLAVGGKYLADNFFSYVGGGGTNVAIGVKKHGWKTAVSGTIGNNSYKSIILNKLNKLNIPYNLCDIVDHYFNLSAIFLTAKGERTIIHYVTPRQKLFDHHQSIDQFKNTKMIYLGNLPEINLEERVQLLKFAQANKITTVVNLGVKDSRRSKNEIRHLLEKTNILILNGHEFSELVKAPYKDIHFHEDVINWYVPFLSNQIVIITEGAKGSYGYYQRKVFFQKSIKTTALVDTTGAGDGYTVGFISEFMKTKKIEKSMENGSKYAVKILEKIGAN